MRKLRRRSLIKWAGACAIAATALWGSVARAEIESVELYLYGGFTNMSRNQIRRVLTPYADRDSIQFRQMIRKDGSEHPWVMVVELTPKGRYTNLYQVLHRVKDTRGVNDGRVLWKTGITATGDLRAHFGFTRTSFGRIPGWVQARGLVTSGLWNHLRARGSNEDIVFHPNRQYDRLRLAPRRGEDVRIRGRITGFDGVYPVVVLGEFEPVKRETDDMSRAEIQDEIPRRTKPDLPPARPKRPNRTY